MELFQDKKERNKKERGRRKEKREGTKKRKREEKKVKLFYLEKWRTLINLKKKKSQSVKKGHSYLYIAVTL